MKNKDNSFFTPVKILRDLVHGYINLTEFELKVINTIYFQRLKDIRQLTCQHVYPSARHTRFEHSLGVMELTKNAIRYLNENGFIESYGKKRKIFILLIIHYFLTYQWLLYYMMWDIVFFLIWEKHYMIIMR